MFCLSLGHAAVMEAPGALWHTPALHVPTPRFGPWDQFINALVRCWELSAPALLKLSSATITVLIVVSQHHLIAGEPPASAWELLKSLSSCHGCIHFEIPHYYQKKSFWQDGSAANGTCDKFQPEVQVLLWRLNLGKQSEEISTTLWPSSLMVADQDTDTSALFAIPF